MARVCLVTGASRGIGRATALRLAEDGHDVVVNFRESSTDAHEVAKLLESMGRRALTVRADVSSEEEVASMVSTALEAMGGLDILVNNAGIYERANLEELTVDQWRRVIDVNLTGAFLCLRAVIPHMKRHGWGRIINVSSQIAHRGTDHGPDYAASKAGLLGLTRAAAIELAPFGITVNAVAPGTIDTDIIRDYTMEDRLAKEQSIPAGRIGRPEEVASLISFLASEQASYITGTTILVTGGGYIF